MEILVVFSENNRELGTVEISELTGFHKATTSRTLATLAEYGLVYHSDKTKKYGLGALAYKLGRSQRSQAMQRFVDILGPHIDRLRDKIDETISLELWTGNRTIACHLAESRRPLRVVMPPADILPIYAPAGAKAILSFINLAEVEQLLEDEFDVFTENTISTKSELLRHLTEYNKQGYAIDNQELHAGIYAIGVPVFDCQSRAVAAVSAVMPATRITEARELEIIGELKRTAKTLGKEIKKNNLRSDY